MPVKIPAPRPASRRETDATLRQSRVPPSTTEEVVKPRPLSPKELPAKYKPAERRYVIQDAMTSNRRLICYDSWTFRIRAIIVALPVAIVSSYFLYKRCSSFSLCASEL